LTGGTIDGLNNTTAYHSIATSSGTNNITPLTDMVVANVAATSALSTWFAALTGSSTALTTITAPQVQQAWSGAVAQLLPGISSAISNPITTAFTPTPVNSMDSALTALGAALAETGVSYPVLLSDVASNTAPISGLGATLNAFEKAATTPATNQGSGTYTVGGTVAGLPGNLTIFVWNGSDTLTISSNGAFVFPSTLSSGATYSVNDTVPTFSGQSPDISGETCTIANGTGTIGSANVTNVEITCSSYQLDFITTTPFWGYLAYDPYENIGVVSYNYPTGDSAQTAATLTCTDAGAGCGLVYELALGECGAVASAKFTGATGAGAKYQWSAGTALSTIGGGTLSLTAAKQAAQAQALQNCNAPVETTALPIGPSSTPPPVACAVVVSGCVDGTTPGTVTGGGSSSSTGSAPSVAPADVNATAGNAQVSVSWLAVTGASSYNIYRSSTQGAEGTKINASSTTSFVDTTVVNGTTYYYEITAVNSVGEGPASTQSAAVTPTAPAVINQCGGTSTGSTGTFSATFQTVAGNPYQNGASPVGPPVSGTITGTYSTSNCSVLSATAVGLPTTGTLDLLNSNITNLGTPGLIQLQIFWTSSAGTASFQYLTDSGPNNTAYYVVTGANSDGTPSILDYLSITLTY
jgi:hypothetical protein